MTRSVALLRGINVGGKAKVEMPRLRAIFEELGGEQVTTYLNTGNVIFGGHVEAAAVERAIAAELGLDVLVIVRTAAQLSALVDALPDEWVDGKEQKVDVVFLAPDVDRPAVLDDIPCNPAVEDLRYLPGAAVRRVLRAEYGKARMARMVGTPLYQRVSIRNINTVRKLAAMVAAG